MSARRAPRNRGADAAPESHESLLTVIRENVDGMLVVDREGVVLFANPAAELLLGRAAERLQGTRFGFPLVLDRASEIDVVAAGTPRTAEMRVVAIDWEGEPALLASLRDVTDRKRAEQLLARVGAQQAAMASLGQEALSLAPQAVMAAAARHVRRVIDLDFAAVLELGPEDHELRLVATDSSCDPAWTVSAARIGESSQPSYTLRTGKTVVTHDGRAETRFRPWPPGFTSAVTAMMKDHGRPFGVIVAANRSQRHFDEDELTFLESLANLLASAVARSRAEAQVRHQALHDALTGLPNRTLLLDRLGHALTRSQRLGSGVALLFADLDGFKRINDGLGHHAGDEVLVSLARRLTGALRSSDSAARFGGDEFVVLLENVAGHDDALRAVRRVREAVAAPFVVDGRPHALDVTIGVVLANESHARAADLVRDADAAMYHAKERGRGGHAVFDSQMRKRIVDRLGLEQELRRALDAGELRLRYQPIVSLDTGRVVELEALVRWQHPERGLLEPAAFLDVAIETQLIRTVGMWVLSEACHQTAAWSAAGIGDQGLCINVNMAPSELSQPDLAQTVAAAIEQLGASDIRLQLELTEGALIEDPNLPATLDHLRDRLGLRVALDDFGTGYSSLSYLSRFTTDELKIDRSFISTLMHGHAAPIITAIVNMAKALNIAVVAEGIETYEQAAEAHRLGCDRGQGYFFARPLGPEAVPAFLSSPATTATGDPPST